MIREFVDGVTYREFRAMAARDGWTVERILEHVGPNAFGGPSASLAYEPPAVYLRRVLRRGHTIDDDVVIPYRCLIQLYVEETRLERAIPTGARRCSCGCGSPVFGRRNYAATSCRVRMARRKVTDPQNAPKKSD